VDEVAVSKLVDEHANGDHSEADDGEVLSDSENEKADDANEPDQGHDTPKEDEVADEVDGDVLSEDEPSERQEMSEPAQEDDGDANADEELEDEQ